MSKIKVIVMCGLPGSGKSTLAKEIYSHKPYESYLVDVDNIMISHKNHNKNRLKSILDHATEVVDLKRRSSKMKYLIIDGLFTTQKQYEAIADYYNSNDVDLEFHFFEEDREGCLWNDRGRENDRGEGSQSTIKIAPLEKPNIEIISEIMGIEVSLITHTVTKKNVFDLWVHEIIHKIKQSDNGYIHGDTWSMGGTYGSCWDSEVTKCSGETPPNTFKDLDDIMMEICPNITFLQGRKIYNECVETKTRSESDYYGGTIDYGYYSCNLRLFYNLLKEWGYIPEEYQ